MNSSCTSMSPERRGATCHRLRQYFNHQFLSEINTCVQKTDFLDNHSKKQFRPKKNVICIGDIAAKNDVDTETSDSDIPHVTFIISHPIHRYNQTDQNFKSCISSLNTSYHEIQNDTIDGCSEVHYRNHHGNHHGNHYRNDPNKYNEKPSIKNQEKNSQKDDNHHLFSSEIDSFQSNNYSNILNKEKDNEISISDNIQNSKDIFSNISPNISFDSNHQTYFDSDSSEEFLHYVPIPKSD